MTVVSKRLNANSSSEKVGKSQTGHLKTASKTTKLLN
jgi:hypothetical protein